MLCNSARVGLIKMPLALGTGVQLILMVESDLVHIDLVECLLGCLWYSV